MRFSTCALSKPTCSASSCICSSVRVKNSCRGGSSKRIVTGRPSMAFRMPLKSFFWKGSNSITAARRSISLFANIILRMARIRVSSKNMCSVRHKPIPWAPNLIACCASAGLSALVLISNVRTSSAHSINCMYSGCVSGSVGINSNTPL